MGVPAFFRWLSKKYASIIVHCVEEKPKEANGVEIPVDITKPNPNDIEFDNLYLDMNGIIHPCTHPENKPAPKNEDEMMTEIFLYIDRLMRVVRPRRLLYMAIDGVAPRAKMNQQRSRRFRSAKESEEKREALSRIKDELRSKGCDVLPDKKPEEHFDSNCITPGTPFMARLAACLRYYVHDRMNSDPGWRNIKVILSDANVPGEGEHKIMNYIRKQRAQPDHDPNTKHCLCGADADLIMLGLATHEVNFTIIREEFKPNQPKPCDICGQLGHEMKECTGMAREKQGEHDEKAPPVSGAEPDFIFIRLPVLREYLEKELQMVNLPFEQDFERALDDWVFMCFFVGNDFLPHLPSLEIREGAIDRLVKLYKKCVYKTGGYITDNGFVNLSRVQLVLKELGEVEDEIFKKRRDNDLKFRRINHDKRKRARQWADAPKWTPGGQFAPRALGSSPSPVQNPRRSAYEGRLDAMNRDNKSAANALKSMLTPDRGASTSTSSPGSLSDGGGVTPLMPGLKRKRENEDSDSEPEPEDDVKLWEDGWKDRYYTNKFGTATDDTDFRITVGHEYVLGLCWVLRYYYQGCPSWKWYYPYHYAPFASDFLEITGVDVEFPTDTAPFKPLEQLMGVFPAASQDHVPPPWRPLMFRPESPIIDFYPSDFKIDLNGKKYAWQGVALLPFVEEKRLWAALDSVYGDLTEAEIGRNILGNDRLFVHSGHASHAFLEGLYEGEPSDEEVAMETKLAQGMGGTVFCDKFAVMTGAVFKSPLPQCPDLCDNTVISCGFKDPQFSSDHRFLATILPQAKIPPKVLKPEDFEEMFRGGRGGGRGGRGGRGGYRPQLGFTPDSHYRGGHRDMGPANRHIRAGLGSEGANIPYSYNSNWNNRDRGGHNRSYSAPQGRNFQDWGWQQQRSGGRGRGGGYGGGGGAGPAARSRYDEYFTGGGGGGGGGQRSYDPWQQQQQPQQQEDDGAWGFYTSAIGGGGGGGYNRRQQQYGGGGYGGGGGYEGGGGGYGGGYNNGDRRRSNPYSRY